VAKAVVAAMEHTKRVKKKAEEPKEGFRLVEHEIHALSDQQVLVLETIQ